VRSSTTRRRFHRRVVVGLRDGMAARQARGHDRRFGRRERKQGRREAAPRQGRQLTWSQRLLAPLLLLGPLVVVLDRLDAAGELTLFVLAGAALIPLSWLIGEATDNVAGYTGPGIGGFLNATFGNAPELIIAIVALSNGLTEIVKASLVGSIAGNLLLVLGFTLLLGRKGAIDRRSAYVSLGLVGFATLLMLVASAAGFHGDPDRRSLAELSLLLAALLLVVRVIVMRYALRRQRQLFTPTEVDGAGWTLTRAVVVLGLATVMTAFVTDTLVETLRPFADAAHLSEFFVAVVIVAIVGNVTEHGSAVLLARRGRVKLAVEIPLASSSQIAGLLIPLVVLISWGFEPLALSFRPIELVALGVAAVLPALVLRAGRTTRIGGAILLVAYTVLVVVFYLAGER
jgi:Ca2+:H+ antiporter